LASPNLPFHHFQAVPVCLQTGTVRAETAPGMLFLLAI
jgi:hypothetical protein